MTQVEALTKGGNLAESCKYFAVYLFVPLVVWAIYSGGLWTFAIPAITFGLIPLLELFLPLDLESRDDTGPLWTRGSVFDWALYVAVPIQWGIILFFLFRMSRTGATPLELVGLIWTVGLCCGVFGINVSHELGHRYRRLEQFLGRLLLLTSCYVHIVTHHNRGHHAFFGTPRDPNTARVGEPLYAFWLRAVVGSYISSWRIELGRLSSRGLGFFSRHNEMLWWQVVQVAMLIAIAFFFGWFALLAFLGASLAGVLFLETVNYIEHYGLFRRPRADGRYDTMDGVHAWNSNHPIGRVLLFEVTRHSDHHLRSAQRYETLRDLDESPQMPTGYPGMMILASLPPLFFRVMNPRLAALGDRVARVNW